MRAPIVECHGLSFLHPAMAPANDDDITELYMGVRRKEPVCVPRHTRQILIDLHPEVSRLCVRLSVCHAVRQAPSRCCPIQLRRNKAQVYRRALCPRVGPKLHPVVLRGQHGSGPRVSV
jgi:hypothetical protein